MIRKTLVSIVLLCALFVTGSATLRITDFHADIALDETGTLNIKETLTVVFYSPHHGIEREIPISYRRPTGENLTISVNITSVESDSAEAHYTTQRHGRNTLIRIGDPNVTVTGTHTYTICYSVSRVLLFKEDYIQLYWNVTGNDWDIPINRVSATVQLLPGVPLDQVSTTSYVGYYGANTRGKQAALDDQGRFLFTAGDLSPGEGLTIDVAIPRTAVGILPPTTWQRTLWFLSANKYAALPLVTLIAMIFLWSVKGKDPVKTTIAPRFAPPPGMHAGEAGVLIDDRADLRDISAMVVGLAVKGYLKIKEIAEDELGVISKVKGLFGRGTPLDYTFIRLKKADTRLSEVEQTLLTTIFDDAHSEERTLSTLENQFYKVLPKIKSDLYAGLIAKGYYPHNPERTRRSYMGFGMTILFGGVAVAVVLSSLYMGAAVAVSGLVVLAFSPIMPRKTRKGVTVLQDLLGLSEYIGRAEVEKMEFHDAPKKNPSLFEKLLPYAMALNLTSIWTKQFEGMFEQPPEWYVGVNPVFSAHLFALSMMHISSGMERTFVSAPRANSGGHSAWGGSSSFGGGFSGGGFGGGGGGGW